MKKIAYTKIISCNKITEFRNLRKFLNKAKGKWENEATKMVQDPNEGVANRNISLCVDFSFRRDVDEICAFLRHYAAQSGNSVSTFRDKLSVLSSKVKTS
jgi:hypothetical protein